MGLIRKSIRKMLCALILLASHPAIAVNLVPNPSFETYTLCPGSTLSEIVYATPWSNPTQASPNYFNVCASGWYGVPGNLFGNQLARTGSAYAGFGPSAGGTAGSPAFREYIEVLLVSPLVAGENYSVSFYVSLADIPLFATDRVGAYLSVGSTGPLAITSEIPVSPQIENPAGNFLTDATGWALVSGTYIASGGEDHLTIGNFYDNADTTLVPGAGTIPSAYYYVDDVAVERVCCDADVDGNGSVELTDLNIIVSCLNVTPLPGHGCEPADVNCDGFIDLIDTQIVLCNFATPGSPACCPTPNISTSSPGSFCIDASGDGSDWSWQVDTNPPVTVPGPSPSTVVDLRDAYVSSINASAIAGLGCTAGPGPACFTVTFPTSFQFWVGPPGGPASCLVSGSPAGCPFNPMIYEEAYFPPSLPGLTPGWLTAGVVAFALGLAAIARSRRLRIGRQ